MHACARINSPGFKHISTVSCHSCELEKRCNCANLSANFRVNRANIISSFLIFSSLIVNFFFSVKCLSFDNKEVFLTKRSSSNARQCGLKPDIKELKDLLLEVKNEIIDLKDEFSHEMKALCKYINAGKCHKQITDKNQGKYTAFCM